MADTIPGPAPNNSSGLITSIMDLINAFKGTDLDAANGIADVADPFRQQRPQYQEELARLLKDPGSFKFDPGQQFALDTGLDAVARKGNAMFGTTRAGNTAIELDKYGTGFANQAYNDRIKQLMEMAGVGAGSPGVAASILQQGRKDRDTSTAGGLGLLDNLFGSSGIMDLFKGVGGGITDLFKQIFGGTGVNIDDLMAQLNNNGLNFGYDDPTNLLNNDDIINQLLNGGNGDGSDFSWLFGGNGDGSDFSWLFDGPDGFNLYG